MMEFEEQRRNRRRGLLPYILGAAALAVLMGFGTYSWQQGWLGARHLEKESRVPEQEGAPHAEAEAHRPTEGHEEAGISKGTTEGITLSPEEKANIGLKTEVAALRVVEEVRKINGIVKPHPDKVGLVTSRVAGRAVTVHATLGDRVQKGQDLADVQSVELEKVELDLIQAENRLALAKAELDRIKGLVEKGIAARRELIALENQHNAALNEIEGLTRQLILLGLPKEEITRLRREKTISILHLRAPLTGTVVERNVTVGQNVEPNTHLFKILDPSTMIVEGEAFEDVLPLLRKGQNVRVAVTPYPGEVFRGRIIFISPTVEPEKRTVHLWVEVDNHQGLLKEGFFAQLIVVVREGSRALMIPVEALMRDQDEDFVFVEKDGSYVRTDLVLGTRTDRSIEVRSGLKPGDRVVTEGKIQLYAKYLSARRGESALGGHAH